MWHEEDYNNGFGLTGFRLAGWARLLIVLLIFPIYLINSLRQFAVFVRHHVAGVVRGEMDFNSVPHVAPIRVMVVFFGGKGDLGHEGERFGEVSEFERVLQAIFFFVPHGLSGVRDVSYLRKQQDIPSGLQRGRFKKQTIDHLQYLLACRMQNTPDTRRFCRFHIDFHVVEKDCFFRHEFGVGQQ